ncbi:MAG TPA: hypothetical protein VGS23_00805 [Thermoplasmata archaeon]|nr:hypothetical protein [Thermoplasmata archaeon]
MADLATILLLATLILDFVFSLWNAYASGENWALVRNLRGQRFTKACAVVGALLAFAGISYVLVIAISYAALVVGVLAIGEFLYLASFDFLVFGAMIIGFGLVITAQSVAVAYRQRKFGDIAIAAWNVFSEIWDISIYAEGFHDAAGTVSGERERVNVYAIIAVAVGIAFLITFVAFRHGARKVEDAIRANPRQAEAEGGGLEGTSSAHSRRIRPRVIYAGIAVVVAIVVVLAVYVFTAPAPKVHVSEIDVWAPDNVCGLRTHPVSYDGFDDSPGGIDAFSLQVPNFNSTPCTLRSAATNTSGFALSGIGVPTTVPGANNGTLNLTVTVPGSPYSGVLDLVYG